MSNELTVTNENGTGGMLDKNLPPMERIRNAQVLIQQVKLAGVATIIALKQLRDDKIHELLKYQDFQDFCDNEFPFLKPRQISQYLLIADTYDERQLLQGFVAKQGTNAMLEVADEIRSRGIEASSLSNEELEELFLKQKKNIKKLEKEKKAKDDIIIMKDAELRRKAEMLQTIEEDYREKIDALAKGRSLPERNRETKKLIMELLSSVTQIQSELVSIPAEERDTELVNLALMSIGVFRNMANQISDAWNNDLHDMEFQSSESQRDPKFDDDLKALAAEED